MRSIAITKDVPYLGTDESDTETGMMERSEWLIPKTW